MRTTCRAGLLVVLASLVWLAWPLSTIADDFHFREYTYGASTCTGVKDPMNFYYGGSLGNWVQAVSKTETVLGWRDGTGSDQWFHDDGVCQKQDAQRAGCCAWERDHTRINQGRWVSPDFGLITASPMHHEKTDWCGHYATSFNAPRNWAAQRYQAAGYFAVFTFTGNTAWLGQCNGNQVRSDGSYVLARD